MKDEWSVREYVDMSRLSSMAPEPSTGLDADAHGSGALLPWPSFGWQQAALAGAVVLGGIVAYAGFASIDGSDGLMGGLIAGLIGIAFAAMAVYAGWSTRLLNDTAGAPTSAKLAGGLAIVPVIVLAIAIYCVFSLMWSVGWGWNS